MPAVRNVGKISSSRKPKPIPVIHFIPPAAAQIYKIEIVTNTTTEDVTDLLVNGEYTDGVTDAIGSFFFRLLDANNTLGDIVTEFNTVNVYLDYGNVATTLRFAGKIERKSSAEQIYLDVSGRSIAMITTGVNVTYDSEGPKSRSSILSSIINKYFSGTITTSGLEDDNGPYDVNYAEMPFWSVVEDICNAGPESAGPGRRCFPHRYRHGTPRSVPDKGPCPTPNRCPTPGRWRR